MADCDDASPSTLDLVTTNPWAELRTFTQARLAQGRAGISLPTSEHLRFQLDHARAIDAVHQPLDLPALLADLERIRMTVAGITGEPITVSSRAKDRFAYLQRPDLGRQLSEPALADLYEARSSIASNIDLLIVLADGLSPRAVQEHAPPFLESLLKHLVSEVGSLQLGPLILATQARVAIGDDIGASLDAKLVLVLIGERPGLSAADSLGAYLSWAPRRGNVDSMRNCISNIRPEGLNYAAASAKACYLIREAFRLQLTGVELKDRVDEGRVSLNSDTGSSKFSLAGRGKP
ncbi:MAG: ethanolamine ammonia-lyase subunit EutC [Pseudomonadota bacterium]